MASLGDTPLQLHDRGLECSTCSVECSRSKRSCECDRQGPPIGVQPSVVVVVVTRHEMPLEG
jgi:hypothetical protein